jgi:pimeloyl-[acyl-carrier protein] methyl ester esterase
MSSAKSEFKLLERGFKDTLVLIPGWATDYRIFAALSLNYNYLLATKVYPFRFKQELLGFLNRKSLDEISLFGWSMGGFLAVEFAIENLQRVGELILAGMRKSFEPRALEEIKRKLLKNKRAYLYKFYLDCFSAKDKEGIMWFKKKLLKDYINEMELGDLICGLDYLSQASINPASLASVKRLKVFHGLDDRVVPLKEINEIESCVSGAKFVYMPGVGHISFINNNFTTSFLNG